MYKLPDLPYAYDALEPTISANTLHFHHDKHHAAYVTALNGLLNGDDKGSLEAVIKSAARPRPRRAAELAAAIESTFGGLDALKEKFVAEGVGHFGSGWVWLVSDASGALKIISTHDADSPVTQDLTALLVCDVWEHAYYLDYQNLRKGFLEAFFDNLANWTLADSQYAAAKSGAQGWAYPAPE
ncbi:Superoxide dismutase [Aphelenchoides fujianensis]|nr:Superoxide dismutase [Aphelenchoides fujianensis]